MSWRHYFTLITSLFIFACSSPKNDQANNSTVDSILNTVIIDSLLQAADFNGVVYISQGEKSLYNKAVGYADLITQEPLKKEDLFVIGSISKQITAVLVLRAVEEGTLNLEDKMAKYLPQLPLNWKKEVSIHQLLTHTHGIVSASDSTLFEAGDQFRYSQIGYDYLAQILEVVYEESFSDLSKRFFKEHQLKGLFHPIDTNKIQLIKGYEPNNDGVFKYSPYSLENYAAAGSFIANVKTLDRWNHLLHQGKLLNAESLELMQKDYATRDHPIFGPIQYGYGLLFKKEEAKQQIGTLGYSPGFVSASYYYPQKEISVVILSNEAKDINDFSVTFALHLELLDYIHNI